MSKARIYTTVVPAIVLAAVVALSGGTVAAVKATEKPSFCATCHEMTPYHDAWKAGPHKGVSCVACHVDPGAPAQLTHKVSALKEVFDHYATSPKFPGGGVAVPNSRCLACHGDLPARTKSGFPHAQHVKEAACVGCHSTTGHRVSPDTLRKAGLLAAGILTASDSASAETSGGVHVKVDCSRCHDLAKTVCATCHTAPHKPRGGCPTCHAAGVRWTFAHPDTAATCTTCHEVPKNHFTGTCVSCHDLKTPFANTAFRHTSAVCSTCHITLAGHAATALECSTCHRKTGVSWVFGHPASSACADCHRRPAGHFSGACASCHSPSVPFAQTTWRHPTSTTCQSCHSRPGGHRSGTCYTCHRRPGRSWAFSHPGSSACASCHRPPASHFGSNCAGCHSPGRAWTGASFAHPSTHHDWRSMACANCHPSGPPRVGCTCHGGGSTGPSGG
ncbi:MAG TPA: NapC/NirT family cytochrome c [Coriobacteriia bacterium]